MDYTPIYALIAVALAGAAVLLLFRIFARWRAGKADGEMIAQQARNARAWESRNDGPSA